MSKPIQMKKPKEIVNSKKHVNLIPCKQLRKHEQPARLAAGVGVAPQSLETGYKVSDEEVERLLITGS